MIKKFTEFEKSLIILILGMIIGTLLLWKLLSALPIISHDDGISYLTAMGNESKYVRQIPDNKWIDAKEIKTFWTKTDFFEFDTIRTDLAHGDYHPPLYFWLLHLWSYGQEVNIFTGPHLNIFFYLLTTILIFLICERLQCQPIIAIFISLLWLFNSSIMTVVLETRQYVLLALVSSLYLLSLLIFLQERHYRSLVYVCISMVLGMLTHYHFALLIMVSVMYLSIYFILKKEKRILINFLTTCMIACIFFIVLHPDFYLSFLRQQHNTHIFSIEAMSERKLVIIKTFKSLLPSYTFDIEGIVKAFRLFMISMVIIFFYKYFIKKDNMLDMKNLYSIEISLVIIMFIGVSVIVSCLYVCQYSPGHAMSVKYLMLITPLLFITLGLFINHLINRKFVLLFLGSLVGISLWESMIVINNYTIQSIILKKKNMEMISKHTPLIIDTRARGVLPRLLWDVDDKQEVYVSTQKKLLHNLPNISKLHAFIYISNYSYENNVLNQKKIINAFKKEGFFIQNTRWNCTNSKFFNFIKNSK